MSRQLTEDDGRIALQDHVSVKAEIARDHLASLGGSDAIVRLLDDRSVVRYPVSIRFEAESLEPGEFAFPMQLGSHPSEGFCLFIHPRYERRPETWPAIVGYYIPLINYGEIVTETEAELFGAGLLGMEREQYYQELCRIADLS